MKLTVEFDLWEEREEFEHWYKGVEYRAAIDEFRNWMRGKRKHENGFDDEEAWNMFHRFFEEVLD